MMTTTVLRTFAPPYAPRVWIEGLDLLVELPAADGGLPYIVKYPVTEAGLSKAINILRVRATQKPIARERSADKFVPDTTPAERRNAAREVLKKMGLV